MSSAVRNIQYARRGWRRQPVSTTIAVLALALGVLGDAARSEETVRVTLLRLWQHPDAFDPDQGSLRSFLLARAHGYAIEVLRSEAPRRHHRAREAHVTAEAGYDLEREAWDLAVADHVRDAVADLPAGQRDAVVLAYFGGHTSREVARLLAVPEATVNRRIRAALTGLRSRLVEARVPL
jgi:RNA polymerase sigma-70 factor (ECF subfamily)